MIPSKTSRRSPERLSLSVFDVIARHPATVRASAPSLVVTLETSVARIDGDGADLTLDRAGCLFVPRRTHLTLRAPASAGRVAVLAFHDSLVDAVARSYKKLGITAVALEQRMKRFELLPRTTWIHEIVHRYVFERIALAERYNLATRFLEVELLKEVYFLFRDRDEGAERASVVRQHDTVVERAIAYVEAHVFDACSVGVLAAHAGTSESTLLRAFRRELGATPAAYWRSRKLDEGLVRLRAGRHSVAEVAALVGYDNASFAYAFRRRFGKPPTAFRPRRPARPAP